MDADKVPHPKVQRGPQSQDEFGQEDGTDGGVESPSSVQDKKQTTVLTDANE